MLTKPTSLVRNYDDRERWEAALTRAWSNQLGIGLASRGGRGRETTERTYYVSSGSHDHVRYTVEIWIANGEPEVGCTCKAGEFGQICQHQALALWEAGLWAAISADAHPEPPAPATAAVAPWATVIHGRRYRGRPEVALTNGERSLPLPRVEYHNGFEWGYTGSGPHVLARSILLAVTRRPALADQLTYDFTREVIAQLPHDGWALLIADVHRWVRAAQAGDQEVAA